MVVNYILPISCLLFRRSWVFPNSTTLSRVINSLLIIKTYLIRHAIAIPAKMLFCWLKVWIIINGSQLQLLFPNYRMISLKNRAVHLMTKIVCLMTVQNVHLENYTSYLIPTLIQNLISILILILIQAAWYLSNVGKNPISMLSKYPPVSHFYREVQRIHFISSRDILIPKDPINRRYTHVKEALDHGKILVHVDYVESYKSSQQNEIQSVYFENSTFSIFAACF